ncbi:MAG: hypothetical protein K0R26_957 [Bacteroidota bacterium]|jgi:hypothetical protein|nr:hypothetical protein [Bacteroidota bacterium]
MKNVVLTVAAILSFTVASAQKISVKDGSQKFSSGSHNAYSVVVYEASKDDVESKWKSYLKNFKNEKVKTDNGEIFGDNVLIKDWGNNPVDVYTKFEEDKTAKTVTMHVAFDLGGAYLSSSDGDKHSSAKKMLKEFAVKTTKESMEDKVKDQEKVLTKLEDNQRDLEKENKNSKSDIENYKAKIRKAEEDIAKNEAEQVKKKSEIDAQKKVVEAAKAVMNKVD